MTWIKGPGGLFQGSTGGNEGGGGGGGAPSGGGHAAPQGKSGGSPLGFRGASDHAPGAQAKAAAAAGLIASKNDPAHMREMRGKEPTNLDMVRGTRYPKDVPNLSHDQATAASKFTYQWDGLMRQHDRGASRAELTVQINKQWAAHPDHKARFLAEHYPGETGVSAARVARDVAVHAEHLNKAIADHGVKVQGSVFRGLANLSKDQFHQILGQKEMRLGAMSSTSTNPILARGFLEDSKGQHPHGVLLEIRGAKGLPVEHFTKIPGEREVVLDKHTSYRILERRAVEGNPHHAHIILEPIEH